MWAPHRIRRVSYLAEKVRLRDHPGVFVKNQAAECMVVTLTLYESAGEDAHDAKAVFLARLWVARLRRRVVPGSTCITSTPLSLDLSLCPSGITARERELKNWTVSLLTRAGGPIRVRTRHLPAACPPRLKPAAHSENSRDRAVAPPGMGAPIGQAGSGVLACGDVYRVQSTVTVSAGGLAHLTGNQRSHVRHCRCAGSAARLSLVRRTRIKVPRAVRLGQRTLAMFKCLVRESAALPPVRSLSEVLIACARRIRVVSQAAAACVHARGACISLTYHPQ